MENIFNKYPKLNETFEWDNYKIIEKKTSGICYIFCTGNILAPRKIDTDDWFINHIDYFEWQNLSKSKKIQAKADKIIFVRDFCSKFYLNGINHNIDSIEALVDFLKNETKNYEVYVVGYSAGAYLSLIIGNLLNNAKRIYAFGPIYELLTWHEELGTYTEEDKKYFYKCTDNKKIKYFDIKHLCLNNQNTLIFYGAYNKDDKNQDNIIKKEYPEFKTLPLKTDKHCGNLSHFALLELLTCSDKVFYKIRNAKIKKFVKEPYLLKKLNIFILLKYLIHHNKN